MSRLLCGARRATTARRAGFTIVELLVALALFGIAMTGVVSVVAQQWRAHAALESRRLARAQLVAAADALAPQLRMSAGDADAIDASDLVAVSDTLVDLRATMGAGVVCGVVDPLTIDLPPLSLAAPALVWYASVPQPGDVALVHDDAAASWRAFAIASVGAPTTACASSPLLRTSDVGRARIRLRLATPLPSSVAAGAPIRFVRRVRWLHYRASDGRWYLGEREFDGTTWSTTQPVAGPLRAPGTRGGVSAVAYDSTGSVVPSSQLVARRVARVAIVLRADVVSGVGARRGAAVDTIGVHAAPRRGR